MRLYLEKESLKVSWIKWGLLGWVPIQCNHCLYKKRLGHREPRGKATWGGTAVYKPRREALEETSASFTKHPKCQQSGHPAARAPPREPVEACPSSLAKAPGLAEPHACPPGACSSHSPSQRACAGSHGYDLAVSSNPGVKCVISISQMWKMTRVQRLMLSPPALNPHLLTQTL